MAGAPLGYDGPTDSCSLDIYVPPPPPPVVDGTTSHYIANALDSKRLQFNEGISLGTPEGTTEEYQWTLTDSGSGGGYFYLSPLSSPNRLQVGHNGNQATYFNAVGEDSGFEFPNGGLDWGRKVGVGDAMERVVGASNSIGND